MKRLLILGASVLLAACSDTTEAPLAPSLNAALGASAQVTVSDDNGTGSLRAAIEAANTDPSVTRISVARGLGTVALQSPIVYTGSQALTIHGADLVIDGAGLGSGEPAFLANGGADLTVTQLTVRNAPGYGLQVEVPSDADGVQSLTLDRVTVRDNGLHGVLMNDQATPDTDPADENDPASVQEGSDASLLVRVTGSVFEGNGNSALDYDGLRLNEGGMGGIEVTVLGSRFADNGADGIEFDERGPGTVAFTVQQTVITGNGFYDQTLGDLDDGIDVDEWGEGDIVGRMVQVWANDNAEEGVDLNENEAGNLRIEMHQVEASGNPEEGIDLEEDDDVVGGGDLVADLTGIVANGNGATDGDGGVKLRERGSGDIVTRLVNILATGNSDNGIHIREQDGGRIDGRIQTATATGSSAADVRLRGDGEVRVLNLTAGTAIQKDAGVTVIEKP
jgi:hypothetical protein